MVERSQKTRVSLRDAKIREYFYGIDNTMYPHTFAVDFSDVSFYKVGGESFAGNFRKVSVCVSAGDFDN